MAATISTALEDVLGVDAVAKLVELIGDREDATVAVQNVDGYVLWATPPGAASMYERELQDFSGIHASDFIHPDHVAAWSRSQDRILDGETVNWTGLVSSGSGEWIGVTCVSWLVEDRVHDPVIVAVSVPAEAG